VKRSFFLLVLAVLCCALEARAQQSTYTLETSTFRLVFERVGRDVATRIRECVYTPTGRTFRMREEFPTTIANTNAGWDQPDSVTIVPVSLTTKLLTMHFDTNKSITLKVTSHTNFVVIVGTFGCLVQSSKACHRVYAHP
jgi:hypothetical protein